MQSRDGCRDLDYVKGIGELENVNVKSILLEGNPADKLIRYAEEEKWILLLWAVLAKRELIGCF